uniref:G_PROTEIN_RECEP_F1_2 domain-containing protein n=2 Tax=Caenorhabditis tropicalis TaxID=1561998 RepID=A0A1I7UTW4_9PELO
MSLLGVGLSSWLGISMRIQLASGISIIFIMTGSYVFVYETRSSSIQMNRFKMTRTSTRVLYHGVLFLVSSGMVLFMLVIPEDQVAAKLESLKREPCPTVEFFENNVLVVFTDPYIINFALLYILIAILITIFHILFHVICTVYHLYIVPPKSISIETQKKQRKFFIGIIFQTTIPLFVLWFFVLVLIVDAITFSVSQEIMNLAVVACAAHGLIESVAVISVHQSYRRAVLGMVSRENQDKASDVQVVAPAPRRSFI